MFQTNRGSASTLLRPASSKLLPQRLTCLKVDNYQGTLTLILKEGECSLQLLSLINVNGVPFALKLLSKADSGHRVIKLGL